MDKSGILGLNKGRYGQMVSGHFVPMRSRPIPFRTQGHKLPYHFVPKSYHFVPKVIPFRTHILLYCFSVNLNC